MLILDLNVRIGLPFSIELAGSGNTDYRLKCKAIGLPFLMRLAVFSNADF